MPLSAKLDNHKGCRYLTNSVIHGLFHRIFKWLLKKLPFYQAGLDEFEPPSPTEFGLEAEDDPTVGYPHYRKMLDDTDLLFLGELPDPAADNYAATLKQRKRALKLNDPSKYKLFEKYLDVINGIRKNLSNTADVNTYYRSAQQFIFMRERLNGHLTYPQLFDQEIQQPNSSHKLMVAITNNANADYAIVEKLPFFDNGINVTMERAERKQAERAGGLLNRIQTVDKNRAKRTKQSTKTSRFPKRPENTVKPPSTSKGHTLKSIEQTELAKEQIEPSEQKTKITQEPKKSQNFPEHDL